MREILFRGKRLDNDKWAYGSFCMDALEQKNGLCGVDGFIRRYDADVGKMQMHEVDRETAGQFTGLTDKNGKKIFEGDIVYSISYNKKGIVKWYEEHGAFMIYCHKEREVYLLYDNDFSKIEVIGNIHDNPELLEGRT